MSEAGYRTPGSERRPYDPNFRARPCEACAGVLVVGDSASSERCPRCGREQPVPAVRVVTLDRAAALDEPARLALLERQLAGPWSMPPGAVEFADVLTSELPRALRAWVERCERVAAAPNDDEAAHELLVVGSALGAALRRAGGAGEGDLARRAVWEATTEALWASRLRAMGLSILATGAIADGDFAGARAWIDRMDPRSHDLLADSCHRVPSAALACEQGDFAKVLEHLGRTPGAVPLHTSWRCSAAVNQAHALEKLGDVAGAVDVLVHESQRTHGALVSLARQLQDRPTRPRCEASFPIVLERALSTMVDRVPSRAQAWGTVALLAAALMFLVAFTRAWDGHGMQASVVAAVGGALMAVGIAALRRSRRQRLAILSGCIPVRGRVLSRTRRAGDEYVFEVVVERPGMPEQHVTMTETLRPDVAAAEHAGRAFEALWNPAHPTLFHKMTISVAAVDTERRASEAA